MCQTSAGTTIGTDRRDILNFSAKEGSRRRCQRAHQQRVLDTLDSLCIDLAGRRHRWFRWMDVVG